MDFPGNLLHSSSMSLTSAVSRCASVLLAAAAVAACSAGDGSDGADAGGQSPNSDSVRFEYDGTLELQPSQVESIRILTSADATLGVLILGDGIDASLDRSTTTADPYGVASVVLTAPSQPATFRLRAQLGELSAELPVSVSEIGFADLRIVPKYLGDREIVEWVGDVVLGSSCQEILAKLPEHPGGLRADAPANGAPLVESVPVGPKVAAAIHSGNLVAGCTEVSLTTPGKTAEVVVDVLDRPMALEDAELDVTFEFSPEPTGYQQILQAGTNVLAETAFPPGYPLSGPLLDAMEASVAPGDLAAFQQHRASAQLDDSVATIVDAFDAHGWCVTLGEQSIDAALADAGTDSSTITGRLSGNADEPTTADLVIWAWSGASSEKLGIPEDTSVSWSARPGDSLEIVGGFPFSATRLAGHWMHATVISLYGTSATVASALASEIDCDAVGSAVSGFASCDAACGAALCEAGLAVLWENGLASQSAVGQTTFSLSAAAGVDADAVPVVFTGTWAGSLEAFGKSGSVAGTAAGQAPIPN